MYAQQFVHNEHKHGFKINLFVIPTTTENRNNKVLISLIANSTVTEAVASSCTVRQEQPQFVHGWCSIVVVMVTGDGEGAVHWREGQVLWLLPLR